MEPKFENRYVRSLAVAREFYKYTYFFHPFRAALMLFALLFMFISLCAIGFSLSAGSTDSLITYAVSFFVSALSIFLFWLVYRKAAKIMIDRECELNSGRPYEIYTVATEAALVSERGKGNRTEIAYTQIKKVKTTRNLILLITPANLCFVLNRHGFTRGTADEFIAFLKSRGLRVK